MTNIAPLHLQIPELRNLGSKRSKVIKEQQNLLESLSDPKQFANLVVSLRYVYNPTKDVKQRLKIYLSINHADGDNVKVKSAFNILTNDISLRELYKFQSVKDQPDLIHQLEDWVDVICEIIKDEKFPKNQGYYIPYLFQPYLDHDMLSLCKQLNVLDKKLIIEFTLQTCSNCDKESIKTTIKQTFREIEQNTSRYYNTHIITNELNIAKDIYNQYLNSYVTHDRNLFKYSIRILSESSDHIDLVIKALIQNAFKDDNYGQKYHRFILKRGSEDFNKSLMATKNVELFTDIERSEWKSDFEQQITKRASQSQNSNRDIIRLPETEPLRDENLLSSSGEIVKSNDSWSLGKYFESSPDSNKVSTNPSALKLLHRLVTPQEISSLFRIVVSGDDPVPGIPQEQPSFIKPTAEEIFSQYSYEITEDKYIIGMNDDGSIVCSEWNAIAHRLVAGVNGSGKTNFLHWVMFQFLYANPERKVYIFDFKKVDFHFYKEIELLKENVKLVNDMEEAQKLLETIYSEDYQKRQTLLNEERVSNIEQLQKSGVNVQRILLVVDEAADIPINSKTSKMRDAIEGKLEEYARKGRAFGIHLMYCTQTPKAGLISAQVTSQLDERIIFRVSEDAGDSVLGNLFSAATKIPIGNSGCGRAIWRGNEGTMYVNTPKIEIPDACIPVDKTLWSKIRAKI